MSSGLQVNKFFQKCLGKSSLIENKTAFTILEYWIVLYLPYSYVESDVWKKSMDRDSSVLPLWFKYLSRQSLLCNDKKWCIPHKLDVLTAFACNTKSFATGNVFFSFFFSTAFLNGQTKVFYVCSARCCCKRVWPVQDIFCGRTGK